MALDCQTSEMPPEVVGLVTAEGHVTTVTSVTKAWRGLFIVISVSGLGVIPSLVRL